jgi:hypothetical protein
MIAKCVNLATYASIRMGAGVDAEATHARRHAILLALLVTRAITVFARHVPVGTHGHPEGVIVALVPNSFAMQDLSISALATKAQAAARRAPVDMHGQAGGVGWIADPLADPMGRFAL